MSRRDDKIYKAPASSSAFKHSPLAPAAITPLVTLSSAELNSSSLQTGLAANSGAEAVVAGYTGAPRGCRGTRSPRVGGLTAPRNCATLGCEPNCDCLECLECQRRRHRHRGGRRSAHSRHPSLRFVPTSASGSKQEPLGPIDPSPTYLRAAAVPSIATPSDHPLVVISLEGVLCAHLPAHLQGGHTNVLSRFYLDTFMDYLLHPNSRWSVAFWTGSMERTAAIEILKSLHLPIGAAEKDERDGVVGRGLSKEDLKTGWDGGELEVKDLQLLWDDLREEEGIVWTLEDTVVITDFPGYMKAQLLNYILSPHFSYKTSTPAFDDQSLLMLIAILEDLLTESNFAYHVHELGWGTEAVWLGTSDGSVKMRDELVHNAVRICGKMHLVIKGGGGN